MGRTRHHDYCQQRPGEEIDIDAENKRVVVNLLSRVEATFQSLMELQKIFTDNFYIDELREGLKKILKKYSREQEDGPCAE